MFEIRASDLGLRSDRLVFTGSSPSDAVAQVVAYLDVEYGIRLPDAHVIFREGDTARWVLVASDAGVSPDRSGLSETTTQAAILENLRRGVVISAQV